MDEPIVFPRPEIHLPVRRTNWTATELLATELPQPRFAVEGLLPELGGRYDRHRDRDL